MAGRPVLASGRGGFEVDSKFVRGELLDSVSVLSFLGRAGPMVTCTAEC